MAKQKQILAHKASSYHFDQLNSSELCGCFYCLNTYPPGEIDDWVDRGETARCPRCGIDSVIGSASGYPVERGFLKLMRDHWFGEITFDD